MKNEYIVPCIEIENVKMECPLLGFSKVNTQAIGEGDEVNNGGQLGSGTTDNESGEGLNSKHRYNFYSGYDF